MAIQINEKFQVDAPIDVVWAFMTTPERVVKCMPGAQLIEQVDDSTYLGAVKVRLGAITTAYKGEVVFHDTDAAARTMRLVGEGKETGGGTAKGTVDIAVKEMGGGTVEIAIDVEVDLTGRVMQVGGGMIKGVSKQLFGQFARSAKQQLEDAGSSGEDAGGALTTAPAGEEQALAVAPLLARTLWAAILNFFRRLFGKPTA